jgi:hypothetical protein
MAQRMTYQWGRKTLPVSAQVAGEEIERIADQEGFCTPSRLVEVAEAESSPLHPLFTWDNEVAASNWRTHEARQVLNNLVVSVKVDGKAVNAPAFISVGHTAKTREAGEGYRPVSVVVSTPEFSEEALGEAVSRLYALRKRYEAIEALTPVWSALEAVTLTTSE